MKIYLHDINKLLRPLDIKTYCQSGGFKLIDMQTESSILFKDDNNCIYIGFFKSIDSFLNHLFNSKSIYADCNFMPVFFKCNPFYKCASIEEMQIRYDLGIQ